MRLTYEEMNERILKNNRFMDRTTNSRSFIEHEDK